MVRSRQEFEEQLKTSEKNLAGSRKEIADLKRRLEESELIRNQLAQRVTALENSTSWRVTAPLRKVSSTLKKP